MHNDTSHRVGAIHRAWRQRAISDKRMQSELRKVGADTLARLWTDRPKPEPRTISFEVTMHARKRNAQGVFYEMTARIESQRTPDYHAIYAALSDRYEIHGIKEIKQKAPTP
jgi:hypothetical protein